MSLWIVFRWSRIGSNCGLLWVWCWTTLAVIIELCIWGLVFPFLIFTQLLFWVSVCFVPRAWGASRYYRVPLNRHIVDVGRTGTTQSNATFPQLFLNTNSLNNTLSWQKQQLCEFLFYAASGKVGFLETQTCIYRPVYTAPKPRRQLSENLTCHRRL